ncbi:hypothetical protein N7463_004532 [Penicillium fimorum]|uniref:BTB domain-containing protein n=1 Tax=Penicillium fimorum TaxID=1882269 RepID=A0A9W9Y4J2_9EURO|nr:hypothetical protein N7463_004532 [Penicillium fimorum]
MGLTTVPPPIDTEKEPFAPRIRQLECAVKEEEVQDKNSVNELHALASIHLDPRYSDLTIACGDDKYAVHKCIVCPRSAFFAKNMRQWAESSTNRVTLQEKPIPAKGMTEYLYHPDYKAQLHRSETDVLTGLDKPESDTDTTETPSEPAEDLATTVDPLSVHLLMYPLADRMLIKGLKVLSKEKVEQELGRRLNSKIFPHAITQIYNPTPENDRGMRDMTIRMTMDNPKEPRTAQVAPSAFPERLVRSTPQVASDLAVAMIERTVSDW